VRAAAALARQSVGEQQERNDRNRKKGRQQYHHAVRSGRGSGAGARRGGTARQSGPERVEGGGAVCGSRRARGRGAPPQPLPTRPRRAARPTDSGHTIFKAVTFSGGSSNIFVTRNADPAPAALWRYARRATSQGLLTMPPRRGAHAGSSAGGRRRDQYAYGGGLLPATTRGALNSRRGRGRPRAAGSGWLAATAAGGGGRPRGGWSPSMGRPAPAGR